MFNNEQNRKETHAKAPNPTTTNCFFFLFHCPVFPPTTNLQAIIHITPLNMTHNAPPTIPITLIECEHFTLGIQLPPTAEQLNEAWTTDTTEKTRDNATQTHPSLINPRFSHGAVRWRMRRRTRSAASASFGAAWAGAASTTAANKRTQYLVVNMKAWNSSERSDVYPTIP